MTGTLHSSCPYPLSSCRRLCTLRDDLSGVRYTIREQPDGIHVQHGPSGRIWHITWQALANHALDSGLDLTSELSSQPQPSSTTSP